MNILKDKRGPVAPDAGALAICQMNDQLRRYGLGGRVVITAGIAALADDDRALVLSAVRDFDAFNTDNDPYGEHDCATVEIGDHRVIWKIDYYDQKLAGHSSDPSAPEVTQRVLTIMLAEEN